MTTMQWEAIEPYGTAGDWLGRAQSTDEHTTECETCDHHHANLSAAQACGQEIAAVLRAVEFYGGKVMALVDKDTRAGIQPPCVASFSELHDHVDANDYLTQAGVPWTGDGTDAGLVMLNAVSAEVDGRLRLRHEGRPDCPGHAQTEIHGHTITHHQRCPEGTHDRSLPDDCPEQARADDGLLGCNGCRQPMFYCTTDENYHHTDPAAECWLCPA